jgi:hypothetical protein
MAFRCLYVLTSVLWMLLDACMYSLLWYGWLPDVLRSVVRSRGRHYVVMELGSSYGVWGVRAIAAYRRLFPRVCSMFLNTCVARLHVRILVPFSAHIFPVYITCCISICMCVYQHVYDFSFIVRVCLCTCVCTCACVRDYMTTR